MVHVQTGARQWDILKDPTTNLAEAKNAIKALTGIIHLNELPKLKRLVTERHPDLLPELEKYPGFEKTTPQE